MDQASEYYWKYRNSKNQKTYFPQDEIQFLEQHFLKWNFHKGPEIIELSFQDENFQVNFSEKQMKNIKTDETFKISRQCQLFSSLGIVLIVCRNKQNKFLTINEFKHKGWWLPGGKLKPPETFSQGAIRETKEEGGIDVVLKGILRFEYKHYSSNSQRIRIIYYAEPADENQQPKNFQDKHSKEARFVTLDELLILKQSKDGWRNDDLFEWGKYIENGGQIYPLQALGIEGSQIPQIQKQEEYKTEQKQQQEKEQQEKEQQEKQKELQKEQQKEEQIDEQKKEEQKQGIFCKFKGFFFKK